MLLDNAPAPRRGRPDDERIGLVGVEIDDNRLDVRIGGALFTPAGLVGAGGRETAPRLICGPRKRESRRVGGICRHVCKNGQAHRLEGEIAGITERQRRNDKSPERFAEAPPPAPPNDGASGEKEDHGRKGDRHAATQNRERGRGIDDVDPRQGDGEQSDRRREDRKAAAPDGGGGDRLLWKMLSHMRALAIKSALRGETPSARS